MAAPFSHELHVTCESALSIVIGGAIDGEAHHTNSHAPPRTLKFAVKKEVLGRGFEPIKKVRVGMGKIWVGTGWVRVRKNQGFPPNAGFCH